MEYAKVKSVAKMMQPSGPELVQKVRQTLKLASDMVGATLGPGGRPVLIERYENGLPALVTKDGVTVYRALGCTDSAMHCILETARDSSVRTAAEAGDGTTTSTILAEAIVDRMFAFCEDNPRVSPQRVLRHLEMIFRDHIEPTITKLSRKLSPDDAEDAKLLYSVAKVSANGDSDLADAVMKCFEVTGDEGNVTISERSGRSHYEVETIDGFTIPHGYDQSCAKFAPAFINDPASQRCFLEKPVFLLYNGSITEIQSIIEMIKKMSVAWKEEDFSHNLVIVATGFSEDVLGNLAVNFRAATTVNVFPLTVPMFPYSNGQLQFLQDLQAVTGARILDPITSPINQAELSALGPGVASFEALRFRSTVVGHADEDLLLMRVDELKQQLENPESELDAIWIRERAARLSGSIARLWVVGSSNGEMKEKRDRAEDAVCAVRGAIKNGCLPGGAWTLLKLCSTMPFDPMTDSILRPAFLRPFERLASNCGVIDPVEFMGILEPILKGIEDNVPVVYDFLEQKHVEPFAGGVLDSTPAVLEAIRTSISVSSNLGTLGGTVVFARDRELERSEAKSTAEWMRTINTEYNEE